MIIVRLKGGLGNQMFQYAFGRYLSVKNNTELKLDLSFLQDRTPREDFTFRDYELNGFSILESFASADEVAKFHSTTIRKIFNLISLYLPFPLSKFFLKEPHFHFFKKALRAPANTYVDGYWQSEKYFKEIGDVIRKEFTLRNSFSGKNHELSTEIEQSNSVSIHVRRKDYVENAVNKNLHGIYGKSYYEEAIKLMSTKIRDPEFFIFSDEPEWFKKNVVIDFPVRYIEHNLGLNNFEDLILMSMCKNNIITNSTFSWWGAWLNLNKEKIVIAPKEWFAIRSRNAKDVYPENWTKI